MISHVSNLCYTILCVSNKYVTLYHMYLMNMLYCIKFINILYCIVPSASNINVITYMHYIYHIKYDVANAMSFFIKHIT